MRLQHVGSGSVALVVALPALQYSRRRVANEDGGRTTLALSSPSPLGHFWCPPPLARHRRPCLPVGNPGTLGSRNVRFRAVIRVAGGPPLADQRPTG